MGQRKNSTPKPDLQPAGHLVSAQAPHLAARLTKPSSATTIIYTYLWKFALEHHFVFGYVANVSWIEDIDKIAFGYAVKNQVSCMLRQIVAKWL